MINRESQRTPESFLKFHPLEQSDAAGSLSLGERVRVSGKSGRPLPSRSENQYATPAEPSPPLLPRSLHSL